MAISGVKIKAKPSIEFSKFLLKTSVLENDPMKALMEVRENIVNLAKSFANSAELIDSKSSTIAKAGAFSTVGSVMVGLGLASSYVFLPVGLTVGALGIAKFFKASRNFQFLKTFYSCMKLMQSADKVVSKEEISQMNEFILSLGLSDKDKDELLALEIPSVDALQVPSLSADQKNTILRGCFGMAYCDGVAPQEEEVFGKIGQKFGISPDEINNIKNQVKKNVEELDRSVVHIAALVSFCIPNYFSHEEKVFEMLSSICTKVKKPEELKEPVTEFLQKNRSIEFFLTIPSFINNVLVGMYILSKGLMASVGAEWKPVYEKFSILADKSHKEEQAFALKKEIDLIYDAFSKELDKVYKL